VIYSSPLYGFLDHVDVCNCVRVLRGALRETRVSDSARAHLQHRWTSADWTRDAHSVSSESAQVLEKVILSGIFCVRAKPEYVFWGVVMMIMMGARVCAVFVLVMCVSGVCEAGCADRATPRCCPGRNNECVEKSARRTVCYCDTYCRRSGDCCDDYQTVCHISGEWVCLTHTHTHTHTGNMSR